MEEPEYTIHLTRTGGGSVASIAELGLVINASTPDAALAGILNAEREAREAMVARGLAPPPVIGGIDPFPGVSGFLRRHSPFLAKVAAGYVFVLFLTGLLLALIAPLARARAVRYYSSGNAAAGVKKVLPGLGINACVGP